MQREAAGKHHTLQCRTNHLHVPSQACSFPRTGFFVEQESGPSSSPNTKCGVSVTHRIRPLLLLNRPSVSVAPLAQQDVDKLKGMKWLLAMVSKGRDVSEFFSDVVKNMAVRSVEVKKMVYIYLVHYADNDAQCRELALLSINSFQNDLRGSNQVCMCMYAQHGG